MMLEDWPRRSKVSEIAGVERIHLESHADAGGVSTQVFHREWQLGIHPVQWNAVQSEANVLRGVHVHVVHEDYFVLLKGQTLLGLRDLRPGSPTEGNTAVLELKADQLEAVCLPPGVAHGFYFTRRSLHLYSVSHYWNLADELGCHWADPELRLDWPVRQPLLSQRDASAGSLRELVETLRTRLQEAAPS
jgi:dTDP-4-dehydrorhamnose 3,5-epimerase